MFSLNKNRERKRERGKGRDRGRERRGERGVKICLDDLHSLVFVLGHEQSPLLVFFSTGVTGIIYSLHTAVNPYQQRDYIIVSSGCYFNITYTVHGFQNNRGKYTPTYDTSLPFISFKSVIMRRG